MVAGECKPPVIIRGRSHSTPTAYCYDAEFLVNGTVISRVVSRPDKPLDCGARLWLELETCVEVVPHVREEEAHVG